VFERDLWLNRLFGFPVVDEDGSVRNIRKIASPKKQTREQAKKMDEVGRRSVAALTKYYILAYRRYGRWPPIKNPGPCATIREWLASNNTNLNLLQDRGPTLEDWGAIDLGPQAEFDYYEDASLLLADTDSS